jgi:hypothetical protein
MRVRMTVQVSGMRNGQEWPARGSVVDLPDTEAAELVRAGMAVPAGEPESETATPPTESTETRTAVTTEQLGRGKRRSS